MRRVFLPFWLGLAAASGVQAGDPAFEQVVAAERAFAADAMARTPRAAFVSAFARDALVIAPDGPVSGREYYAQRPEFRSTIEWGPEAAEVALSGDLGYTYGPAIYRSVADPAAPPSYGHYFSIWERDANGSFFVVHDIGISHPAAASVPRDVVHRGVDVAAREAAPPRERNRRLQALVFADRMRNAGGFAAVEASDDAVVLRDGAPPQPASEFAAAPPAADAPLAAPAAVRLSSHGDLGVTVGATPAGAKPSIAYQRVWRWNGGDWKLAVDLQSQ
jgi:ketosteroid isomerase-like protein